MPQVLYTMQFKGKAAPINDAGTVLKATTTKSEMFELQKRR